MRADAHAVATLFILGGLPGAGKTTVARLIAHHFKAVHLRIDTIEQALRDTGGLAVGHEGYVIAYRLAEDNLRLGLSVVADSVNPIAITREAWRTVASKAGVRHLEIEIICSDVAEHRGRVETRASDIVGHRNPTWAEVRDREYEPWPSVIVIDTAGKTPAQVFEEDVIPRLRSVLCRASASSR